MHPFTPIYLTRNWFKLFTPKDFNGLELDLPSALNLLIQSACESADGGWIVNLGSGAGFFWSYFTFDTAKALMSDPEFVIAGSGQYTGTARDANLGFLVSGSWSNCSGAAHATHFTVNAINEYGESYSYTLKRNQVTVQEDWPYFGLKNTSTYRITAKDAFVPQNLRFKIGKVIQTHHPYRIYYLPFEVFAKYCISASFIGIAKKFGQQITEHDKIKNRVPQKLITSLNAQTEEAALYLLSLAREDWKFCMHAEHLPATEQFALKTQLPALFKAIYHLACECYYYGGMSMADETLPINNTFRDLLTAIQHSSLKEMPLD